MQPGRGRWRGFGTDIFYDYGRFRALEGGVVEVHCDGTQGGPRAANWVVLREIANSREIITGGIHLSYCRDGCDETYRCELRHLYAKLAAAKRRHPLASRLWMGDLNNSPHSRIMHELRHGGVGGAEGDAFSIQDMAQTEGSTFFTGGPPIDHILGERGAFRRLAGGRTGQGEVGQQLADSDHFPVHAVVDYQAAPPRAD